MATMITSQQQLITILNDLIALDYDAIEAYEAAIDRLKESNDRAQLGLFMEDHRRHVVELTPLVQAMGGKPTAHADMKQILTKGKVVLGGIMGDKVILEAMKSNEDTTNKMYAAALHDLGLPPEVRSILERNLSDERRHRAWIEQRLGRMSAAAGAVRDSLPG